MSKDYRKKCSNCAAEIIMSDATGKWQPMETDNATVHRCIGTAAKQTQGTTPQNGKPMTDDTNKELAIRVSYLENELRKLKEWLALVRRRRLARVLKN